jgi:hypothetical protein
VEYGQIELTAPLAYYHHAGAREYQCEVALLTRTVVVSGNAKSEPTDTAPLQCDPDVASDPDRQVLAGYVLRWNILTGWIFCTGIYLLAGYIDIFGTGISLVAGYFVLESLLTGYFVLEYPYWLDILYWNLY